MFRYYDFAPKYTHRDLSLGEAVRALEKLAGYKVSFWRYPVRGLAMHLNELPSSGRVWDMGTSWRSLIFSRKENERDAKEELIVDLLLRGLNYFCGLPNPIFNDQVARICALLSASPSVSAEEWLKAKEGVHPKFREYLDTHQADLRANLLSR